MDLSGAAVLNAASGVALAALGVLVARAGRERANRAFGLFAVALGLSLVPLNISTRADGALWAYLGGGLAVASVAGLLLMVPAFSVGRPLPRMAFIVAAASVAGLFAGAGWDDRFAESFQEGFAQVFAIAGIWAFLLVVARDAPLASTPKDRRQVLLVSAALVMYPAWSSGDNADTSLLEGSAPEFMSALILLVCALAFMALWVRAAATFGRRAAAVAWLGGGVALTAQVVTHVSATLLDVMYGVCRTAGIVVLGYAIVRYQILGLDVRVRWAISRSTLGALFIAVFFVASEVAQRSFEASVGPYLGIAAAGALVFALAPLQRLADRIASAAVPLASTAIAASPATTALDERAERIYRRAVRAAVEDGELTRAEEEHLAHIAHELGLSYPEALRIRREEESSSADPASSPQ